MLDLPQMIDLELTLLILFISGLTAVAVYLVSIFGIKEKSFEEAIAEQKKRSELLLGRAPVKKKSIKPEAAAAQRKVKKEKQNVRNRIAAAAVEEQVIDEKGVGVGQDLQQEQQIVNEEEPVAVAVAKKEEPKKQQQQQKHKHIEILDVVEVLEVVQDDEIQPPIRRHSLVSATPTKSILLNSHPPIPPQSLETPAPPETINHFTTTHPKDDAELFEKKKKQKPDVVALLQSTTLSQTETQQLIDLLLNKQTQNWTPTSPSAKETLKKELDKKTGQIVELEANLASLTGKLAAVRSESTADRAKFTAIKKQLEELLNNKNLEINNLQQRLRNLAELSASKDSEAGKSLLLYKQRFEAVNEEGERMKGDFLRREGEWRGKVESLERECGALKVSYAKQGSQLSSAFQSNEELTTQTAALTSQFHALQSSIHHANAIITEKDAQINLLSQKKLETTTETTAKDLKIQNLEKSVAEYKQKCEEFGKNEMNLRGVIEGVEGEVGELRGKNQELRLKNVKLLEALGSVEGEVEGKIGRIEELERDKGELKSIFREACIAVGVEFVESAEIKERLIERLNRKSDEDSKLEGKEMLLLLKERLKGEEERGGKLTEEVKHYQSVLASTESLLASLQSSIETEETKWIAKLAEKDARLEEVLRRGLNDGGGERVNNSNGHHHDHTHLQQQTPTPVTPTQQQQLTNPTYAPTPTPHTTPTPPPKPSPSPSLESGELTPSPGGNEKVKKKKKVLGFFSSK